MGCSEKSEGTVRTDSLSTSIRELVDGDSVISTWGGAGARFWMECQIKRIKGSFLKSFEKLYCRHKGQVATYLLRSLFGSLGCSCCVRHVC
jgi:hypothetical protein